jgi:hypothetical protein
VNLKLFGYDVSELIQTNRHQRYEYYELGNEFLVLANIELIIILFFAILGKITKHLIKANENEVPISTI